MTAGNILKLIEEVDPNDTEKLDEIDARVADLLGYRYAPYEYTRSRDALKSIRDYNSVFIHSFYYSEDGSFCFDASYLLDDNEKIFTGIGKTEELAELSAIIQAIAHERGEG